MAGLLVAIPALFIYSYLNSRIKNAASAMQMFIDEFVREDGGVLSRRLATCRVAGWRQSRAMQMPRQL